MNNPCADLFIEENLMGVEKFCPCGKPLNSDGTCDHCDD